MPHKTLLPNALQDYILQTWLREPDVLRWLREETAALPSSGYQIPPDQGQLMSLLASLVGAKNCLEIGVYTGYSALAVALVLPEDGRIVACDINQEYTDIARRYWREAGVAGKIELHLRPAVETLDALLADGLAGRFDFAFIDADKANYDTYYERVLTLIRTNGLILIDNVFWHGRLTDLQNQEADTVALRTLNAKLRDDSRIDLAVIPIGDGVTVARKR